MTRTEKITSAVLVPVTHGQTFLLGLYTILWGIWVANPFWSVFGTAPLYSALGSLAPEMFWGTVAIIVGTATLYGVWRPSYRSLVFGALASGWHWMIIAIFYFAGDWQNTGGITSLLFALYAAYLYLNVKVNHQFECGRIK